MDGSPGVTAAHCPSSSSSSDTSPVTTSTSTSTRSSAPYYHQTSINVIMGLGNIRQALSERTPLLSSSQSEQSTEREGMAQSRPHRMGYLAQVWLLLWKNFLQQRRSVLVMIAEIAIPLLGAIIMLVVRQIVVVTTELNPTISPPVSLQDAAARRALNSLGSHILYAPNTTLVSDIMADVESLLAHDTLPTKVMGFSTEDELVRWYRTNSTDTSAVPFAVIFNDMQSATTLPTKVSYTLRPRTKDKDNWNTRRVFSFYQVLSPRTDDADLYYKRSFMYTQWIIDLALIHQWAPSADPNLGVDSWAMNIIPFPPYINDAMTQVLQQNFPVILMLSFILSVIIMSKNIVYEKERQLKESMKLMGLSAAAHWTAWFLQFFIYLLLVCAVYTLFMSISIGEKKAVLVFSDPSLVFVFLLIYSVSIIAYCFFISTLVNKANIAAAVAGILFFAIFFPYYFLEQRYEDLTLQEKLGVCVLFNMAMSYGMKTIGLYEGTGKGAQWSIFTEPASVDDNFSLLHAMMMLLIDTLIFFILTWYIDNIHPGAYGVPRPWYFPFQASYWCGGGQKRDFPTNKSYNTTSDHHFEREPSGLPVGIRMVHLRKVFDKNKVAVKDSTLTMYEGQITVLLGHNGAGKTTTMSMLTGFIPPSSGTAYVNGYDICTDINNVRSSLGLCPQHNILFDTLTVDEHLTFFARLKGCSHKDVPAAVEAMAKEVGLESKRSARAGTLSGGQKRKLSVGIALIGGSKIVILDEPTSGMDPAARRQTWDVLQRHRMGRTMLLSTHFMDEADLLGNRIAIMAEGVVKCCGTSMFLKKLYGAGYHLILVKGPNCDVEAVTEAVRKEISSAQLESDVGAELSYLLPEDQASSFPRLFEMIESKYRRLGLTNFGASATTMEEVFLKVGASGFTEDIDSASVLLASKNGATGIRAAANSFTNPNYTDEEKIQGQKEPAVSVVTVEDGTIGLQEDLSAVLAVEEGYQRLSNFKLEVSRFYGMFVKKAIHTFRNRIISGVQLALPVLFTIAALTVDKVRPKDGNDPPRTLTLGMFDGTITSYSTGLNATALSQALGSNYGNQFDGNNQIVVMNRSQYPDINYFYLNQSADVGLYTYNKKVVIGADFQPGGGAAGLTATAWFSGQPFHAKPTALGYLMNAFAREVTGNLDHFITTINHPMPKDEIAAAKDTMTEALALGFSIGFSMLFGMAFLTSSFSYFLIRERQTGAKHLQVVSGVGPYAFWLASFAWDMVNYLIPCGVLLIVFAAFQVDAYVEGSNMALVFLVLVVFGIAVIPFTYILQFVFRTPATGFVVLIILAIISGLFTMLTVTIMRIPALDVVDVAEVLDWVFMAVFPHYCVGMGFSKIYINKLTIDFCFDEGFVEKCDVLPQLNPCCKECELEAACVSWDKNYLAWDYPGIGRNVVFMCLHCIGYYDLILIIEYQLPQKLVYLLKGNAPSTDVPASHGATNGGFAGGFSRQESVEDSDVVLERERILQRAAQGDMLILDNLCKEYGPCVAVNSLCVGVPEQECFGLLGQNGAGKTTTFKMLTGDIMATSGDAFVRQYSIKSNIKRVQANMGYCPQFDALIDQMTGRETLTMYARLRGVPESHIPRIVSNLISLMMLQPHADKLTGHYSGGNKRKLSTAIALIGGPMVILLDEPSSGMDPAARRQLWNVLSQVRASGKTLVLTSHSMEECDALCTRIAIMVNGDFKCLGSPQHLKSKFGQGYTLVAKMATLPDGTLAPSQPLEEMIFRQFPGSQKFDDHQGYAHFQVPDASIPLSKVFAAMEHAKSELHIEDYSVHQTTLEQIFLTFTRAQSPPREALPTSCMTCIRC